LPLPADIRAEEISATYRDGILELTMPAVGITNHEPVRIEIGKSA
jgi:HSP20 family molecular chaperone IbpA